MIAGQGTIGLEITEDMPEVELVMVPLSGAALPPASRPASKGSVRTRVIGVTWSAAPP